jgi:phosphonatase-like hydrolase
VVGLLSRLSRRFAPFAVQITTWETNVRDNLPVDLVAFDMGGTTVRDEGVVPYAFRRALEPLGIRLDEEEIAAVRGADKREAIRRLLRRARGDTPDLDAASRDAYARFVAALREGYAEAPLAEVDGASALFAWLRERGAKVALTTGFDRAIRDLILGRLGWIDGRVDAAVSAEEVAAGRPAPYMLFRAMELTGTRSVRRLATVGDTVVDLEAGVNAGAAFVVGILGGAHDLATLGATWHTHLIEKLDQLRSILGPTVPAI